MKAYHPTKPLKAYIATALTNVAAHNEVRDELAKLNISLTYDWTVHGSVHAEGFERIREVALLEVAGVMDADVVIVLLPGGRGTHCELGMAAVMEAPTLIVSETPEDFTGPQTCAFYHLPNVRHLVREGPDWAQTAALVAATWCEDLMPPLPQ